MWGRGFRPAARLLPGVFESRRQGGLTRTSALREPGGTPGGSRGAVEKPAKRTGGFAGVTGLRLQPSLGSLLVICGRPEPRTSLPRPFFERWDENDCRRNSLIVSTATAGAVASPACRIGTRGWPSCSDLSGVRCSGYNGRTPRRAPRLPALSRLKWLRIRNSWWLCGLPSATISRRWIDGKRHIAGITGCPAPPSPAAIWRRNSVNSTSAAANSRDYCRRLDFSVSDMAGPTCSQVLRASRWGAIRRRSGPSPLSDGVSGAR